VYKEICRELGVQVALDLFASDTWHVSDRFVCSTFTPGCVAVQALALDWRLLLNEGEFAWIFPPVRHLSEVVQMIERYRTDCVLIAPEQKATNCWIRLWSWPCARDMCKVDIPRGTKVCRSRRRVLVNTTNPGLFKLKAFRIKW
jgi:hypothetical protein